MGKTFEALQSVKAFYSFPTALDVDRYVVDGRSVDAVVGARELRLADLDPARRNWVNDHTFYTHGYGLAAAYGNRRGPDGQPVFFEQNIPTTGRLGPYEPRIYFGEESPTYSIVGAPPGSGDAELDHPDASAGASGAPPIGGPVGCPSDPCRAGWPTPSPTASPTSCCRAPSTPSRACWMSGPRGSG